MRKKFQTVGPTLPGLIKETFVLVLAELRAETLGTDSSAVRCRSAMVHVNSQPPSPVLDKKDGGVSWRDIVRHLALTTLLNFGMLCYTTLHRAEFADEAK